jgi:undecaprenyl pyrophosphate phosphatase UppP
MNLTKENMVHYGDVLAVPMFFIASIYFIQKKNKTLLENILTLFVIIGFLADFIFTYNFLIGTAN